MVNGSENAKIADEASWEVLGRLGLPGAGLEPACPTGRGILSPLRLPISPSRRVANTPFLKNDDALAH